jgi:hypothetical protein
MNTVIKNTIIIFIIIFLILLVLSSEWSKDDENERSSGLFFLCDDSGCKRYNETTFNLNLTRFFAVSGIFMTIIGIILNNLNYKYTSAILFLISGIFIIISCMIWTISPDLGSTDCIEYKFCCQCVNKKDYYLFFTGGVLNIIVFYLICKSILK